MEQDNALLILESISSLQRILHKSIFTTLKTSLSMSQIMVMSRLMKCHKSNQSGLRVSEIATFMGITVSAVTQIITDLEKKNYIGRQMDPHDRRAVNVYLTEDGEAILKSSRKPLEESFHQLALQLGNDDSKTLINLLHKVTTFFEQE
ncbi:MarR family winged helix-turn-helix transcriptional regulator [Spirochaeta cellobiosiphila]|uniref:MarR family winged helix-turn-helix transcriptional regulator n=1 Tax=Spirochaeta cellobiosiphila TaxID=504483 RepID=UPI0004170238|nr:MarR family transcriptional regulator [Spirochaeta cellobiosiphila]